MLYGDIMPWYVCVSYNNLYHPKRNVNVLRWFVTCTCIARTHISLNIEFYFITKNLTFKGCLS